VTLELRRRPPALPKRASLARDPSGSRARLRRMFGQGALHTGLIAWAIFSLYPLLWVIVASVKYRTEFYAHPFSFPVHFVWGNFKDAWELADMRAYFINSLVVTVTASTFLLLFSAMCGFVLARFDFRFKGIIWAYVLFGFLIPPTLTLIPLAQLSRTLHFYDTRVGLILVYIAVGIPFNTFFLRSYMETIPKELEEAALIDGAGMWTVFRRLIVPLSKPALTTMATFSVLYEWSEFMIALILTGSPKGRTLPVGISDIATTFSSNDTTIAAAMVISIIPALIVFVLLQRYVVEGLSAGALKA
jgi:raffinose/stachyose/melibiose transport system permease protein